MGRDNFHSFRKECTYSVISDDSAGGSDEGYFIRTTEPRHEKTVQDIFEYFLQKGDIYIGIKGEKFDGNEFWSQALDNGADAVIIENIDASTLNEYMFRVTNDDLAIAYRRLCDLIDAMSGRM